MKKIMYFALIVCVVLTASCSKKNYAYYYQENSQRVLEPIRQVVMTPVIGEMEVSSERISYSQTFPVTMTLTKKQWKKFQDQCKEEETGIVYLKKGMYKGSKYMKVKAHQPSIVLGWKSQTTMNAMLQYNADDFLAPTYRIEPDPETKTVKVTFTGFPVHYKRFRAANPEDLPLLEIMNKKEGNVLNIYTTPTDDSEAPQPRN